MREEQVVAALAAGRDAVPSIVESIYDGLVAGARAGGARERPRASREAQARRPASSERDDWTMTDRTRGATSYEQRHRLHQRQPRALSRRTESAARDPEHQRAARARRRRAALRGMVRRRNAPHRTAERPPDRDARQSGRLRRLAGRARRADDSVLRPLRRAAGRSAEPVGHRRRSRRRFATARSTRAAPPTTRARCSCT